MLLSNIQTGRILELGCGDGNIILNLELVGFELHGIDIVPIAVDWAKDKANFQNKEAFFIIGNVTSLPYNNETFDVILDSSCSHCIVGSDRGVFFNETYRVLSPKGLLVSVCLCGDPPLELRSQFDPVTRCLINNGIAGRYYGQPSGILKEMKNAGFHIIQWYSEKFDGVQEEMVICCSKLQ